MTIDVLDMLGEINLALAAAVVAAMLLRRPLRKLFGAQVGYAVWLLPPIAALATQLPVRVIVLVPAAATMAAGPSPQSPWPVEPQIALFAAWLAGAVLCILYFTGVQLRFHASMRAGQAGPAVAGVLRPRIVTPSGFASQFLPAEQDAVMAHERAHLSRQDARINAVAALLRCLCWFNPLVHVGVRLMRMDQEMACDATVLARNPGMRRIYAQALLKSQMVSTLLPLGCHWPNSADHPLTERIAMLKSRPPGTIRRWAGAATLLMVATFAGWSAWAAQPPRTQLIPAAPAVAAAPAAPAIAVAQNAAANTNVSEPERKPQDHAAARPHEAPVQDASEDRPQNSDAQSRWVHALREEAGRLAQARVAERQARLQAARTAKMTRKAIEQSVGPRVAEWQAHIQTMVARQLALLDSQQIKLDAQRKALAALRQRLGEAEQNMRETFRRSPFGVWPAPPPPAPISPPQ